ncbi:MAG: division/cell wall cluster transcriptional repressor MraZ [Chlorobi bacterium]|nr:division/cell wall cluster transcriptional repressor MraZ [Chlorobiota bacterium]
MNSFIGEYTCRVDAKGRILLPAAFKKQMPAGDQEGFVIKRDIFDRCLVLYTTEEWTRQNERIRSQINPYNKEHNAFLRNFYRGAAEVILDSSNRLLIPRRLLEETGIRREVVLAGMDTKIEVWASHIYHQSAAGVDEFARLAEKIMGKDE